MPNSSEGSICVIVGSWPRVSTTFIAQELVGLERLGLKLWLASLKPGDSVRHALHDQVQAHVHQVPRYPPLAPAALHRSWRKVRKLPGYARALELFRSDATWPTGADRLTRLYRFTQAIMLAASLPDEVRLLYAHFILKPGTVARYVSAMTGLPLAGSAHARDIWMSSDQEKRDKIASMRWVTTCNGPAAETMRAFAGDPSKIKLIYHGLSMSRFPEEPPVRTGRDGSNASDPVRLLSVGRAVEKKGFDVLLDSLAGLPRDLNWVWHHVGTGKIIDDLKAQATRLGLTDRIVWHGMQDQSFVIDQYRTSDLFVFPARQASDGDQDGLPNVLMEAQTQALCCLSTLFTAIPELIIDGETGLLVEPGDNSELRDALERLIVSPDLRTHLGMGGYQRVRSHFRAEAGIAEIAELLRAEMTGHASNRSAA